MLLICSGAPGKSPSHNLPRKHPFFIYPPPNHTPRCMNNWRVCRNILHKFTINYYNPGKEAVMPVVTSLFTGPLDHKWPRGLQLKFLNSLKVSTSCWIAHSQQRIKKHLPLNWFTCSEKKCPKYSYHQVMFSIKSESKGSQSTRWLVILLRAQFRLKTEETLKNTLQVKSIPVYPDPSSRNQWKHCTQGSTKSCIF